MDGQNRINLGDLSLPELAELMHQVADEILLREMQMAGVSEG